MGESCWQLDGTIARLALGTFRAAIELTRPADGLTLQIPGAPNSQQAWRILGVDFDHAQPNDNERPMNAARVDAYVRDNDLVATYDEVPPRHVRAQIYWRRVPVAEFAPQFAGQVAAALDLIVSANTSLLDTDPQASVLSSVTADAEVLSIVAKKSQPSQLSARRLEAGETKDDDALGFIVRPAQGNFSYVEIVHPAESCRSKASRSGQSMVDKSPAINLTHHLFQQRLEKGVILRAWIRAALVERQCDEVAALAAYQHFAATEPPLTV